MGWGGRRADKAAPGAPARGDSPWHVVTMPDRPPDPGSRLVTVDDAVLTPLRRGDLRTTGGPRWWISGAVHTADGALVAASQRIWAGDPLAPVPADPSQVRPPGGAPRLEGTWLYVGHWFPQFGHFLVETLTNLWPDPGQLRELGVVGLVGHRGYRGPVAPAGTGLGPVEVDPEPWQHDLLRLAGYGGLGLRLVRGRPVRVDRLLVPSRPVVLKSWAEPAAVDVWRRVGSGVGAGADDKVFLSRRLFHERDRPPGRRKRRVRVEEGWDRTLEQLFEDAGFRVVHPEMRPMTEQVALAKGAGVLAGSSGSQLHLSVFARPGARVLEVGDARTCDEPLPAQRVLAAACGHTTAFAPYRDVEQLRRCLTTT